MEVKLHINKKQAKKQSLHTQSIMGCTLMAKSKWTAVSKVGLACAKQFRLKWTKSTFLNKIIENLRYDMKALNESKTLP